MTQLKNPLEIYKLLPQTNCRQCRLQNCLAFSAAIVKGERKFSDCPHLEPEITEKFAEKVVPRSTLDQQRETHLAARSGKKPGQWIFQRRPKEWAPGLPGASWR